MPKHRFQIDQLIITSPYEEPSTCWGYDREVQLFERKDGWARLVKSLKAEIDEESIQAYRGTVSLPLEPDDRKRMTVKLIDDRGVEGLRIVEVAA